MRPTFVNDFIEEFSGLLTKVNRVQPPLRVPKDPTLVEFWVAQGFPLRLNSG